MAEKVLVVEDEALVRELIVLNLRHAGYVVETAADFATGLEKLLAGKWDLAVLDVMLPGGEGFTLTHKARAQGLRCPILMLTARGDTPSKVRKFIGGKS